MNFDASWTHNPPRYSPAYCNVSRTHNHPRYSPVYCNASRMHNHTTRPETPFRHWLRTNNSSCSQLPPSWYVYNHHDRSADVHATNQEHDRSHELGDRAEKINIMTSCRLAWDAFNIIGPLCGNPSVPSEFPHKKPILRRFDFSFVKLLNKQSSCRWSGKSWSSCDVTVMIHYDGR